MEPNEIQVTSVVKAMPDFGDEWPHVKFNVTLTRGQQTYTTEYSRGIACLRWKGIGQTYSRHHPDTNPDRWHKWCGPFKPGQRVEWRTAKPIDKAAANYFVATLMTAELPTRDDVLSALQSDADCVRHGQTFEEFCGELGYDTDSRKAERAYNACRDIWAALIRLGWNFDSEEAERLRNL